MESSTNPDPTALALQIQSLAATLEELTKQNQEMRQRLQQEDNHTEINRDDDEDRHRRWTSTPKEANSNFLREIRKEIDKLRNAIKGKMNQSLDKIVRKTDSPFTVVVQECPVPSKFRLPNFSPLMD